MPDNDLNQGKMPMFNDLVNRGMFNDNDDDDGDEKDDETEGEGEDVDDELSKINVPDLIKELKTVTKRYMDSQDHIRNLTEDNKKLRGKSYTQALEDGDIEDEIDIDALIDNEIKNQLGSQVKQIVKQYREDSDDGMAAFSDSQLEAAILSGSDFSSKVDSIRSKVISEQKKKASSRKTAGRDDQMPNAPEITDRISNIEKALFGIMNMNMMSELDDPDFDMTNPDIADFVNPLLDRGLTYKQAHTLWRSENPKKRTQTDDDFSRSRSKKLRNQPGSGRKIGGGNVRKTRQQISDEKRIMSAAGIPQSVWDKIQ